MRLRQFRAKGYIAERGVALGIGGTYIVWTDIGSVPRIGVIDAHARRLDLTPTQRGES